MGNEAVILTSMYNLNVCCTFHIEEIEGTGKVILVF